ncbi:MAG: DUF2442 domain-containing protein [Desulfococcaceae bacterium]
MAEHLGGYRLRLLFSDNRERMIDFEPFLSRSINPMIKKYLNPHEFRKFSVEYGDLTWNDYDLCFPLADLYEGKI